MKLQSPTPPPQGKPPESVASNLGHTIELQFMLGEKTSPSHPYSHSISPHSSVQATKPTTTPTPQIKAFPSNNCLPTQYT
jgi:hypothetical protein